MLTPLHILGKNPGTLCTVPACVCFCMTYVGLTALRTDFLFSDVMSYTLADVSINCTVLRHIPEILMLLWFCMFDLSFKMARCISIRGISLVIKVNALL